MTPFGDGDEAARAAKAARFLEGGGVVSLAEWAGLDETDQLALQAAGRVLAVRFAFRVGLASQGDLSALRVLAEVDETAGEFHDASMLRAAVDGLAERARLNHG